MNKNKESEANPAKRLAQICRQLLIRYCDASLPKEMFSLINELRKLLDDDCLILSKSDVEKNCHVILNEADDERKHVTVSMDFAIEYTFDPEKKRNRTDKLRKQLIDLAFDEWFAQLNANTLANQRSNEIPYLMEGTVPINPYRPSSMTYVLSNGRQLKMKKGESLPDFLQRVKKTEDNLKQK